MSVEAQAEVVVEDIQRQLRRQERVTVSHRLHASLQIASLPLRINSHWSDRSGLLIFPRTWIPSPMRDDPIFNPIRMLSESANSDRSLPAALATSYIVGAADSPRGTH